MAHEHSYNVHLADLLRAQGLDVEPEVRDPSGERIDVLIHVGEVRVALECKIDDQRAAEVDAEERLEQDLADAAIAVSYTAMARPRDMTEVAACPAGGEWRTVDAPGLARLVRVVARSSGEISSVVKKFRVGLESAAGHLTDNQARDAINAVNIPWPSREDVRKKPQAKEHPRLRLALLVASAALFHANLDGVLTGRDRPRNDARKKGSVSYEGGGHRQHKQNGERYAD